MENSKQPAYPIDSQILELCGDKPSPFGLTKREYFAGLAMQAFIGGQLTRSAGFNYEKSVENSIRMADELLRQLEK